MLQMGICLPALEHSLIRGHDHILKIVSLENKDDVLVGNYNDGHIRITTTGSIENRWNAPWEKK